MNQAQTIMSENLLLSYIFSDFKPKTESRKGKRYPREKVFIVNESYAGIKNLSDIFADLLYAEYCQQEPIRPSGAARGYFPDGGNQIRNGKTDN
ncbi:hypothetical protein FACS1894211_15510 [Clostridia bacterium]|nr:hypothetical protein FACS1894211_15510 [Clostridia bacterium]